jgi:hypothetical protein
MLCSAPFVLQDDSLSDHLARMLTDVRLMKGVGRVDTRRGEVSEVLHRYEIEVVVEVASVITSRHRQEFRNHAQSIERFTKCMLGLEWDPFSPTDRDDLAKHRRTSRRDRRPPLTSSSICAPDVPMRDPSRSRLGNV